MSKKQSRDDRKGSAPEPRPERMDDRVSPGSGEDEAPADLQPDDVENGTPR